MNSDAVGVSNYTFDTLNKHKLLDNDYINDKKNHILTYSENENNIPWFLDENALSYFT